VIATTFRTGRLTMLPLQVEHAAEMVGVLADPPTVEALEDRYRRQLAGPGRADEHWLNWVIQYDDHLVGYVQATVTGRTAEIAWVIGTAYQGHGYAKEAAAALVNWLDQERVIAHIHPGHTASAAVAAAAGLTRTDQLDDGEYLWTT
jgi:RimJ/RimL family protein N-acetyltransferase